MTFEVFDRTQWRQTGELKRYVRVQRNGDSLYLGAAAKDLLGSPGHVALLFDQAKRRAALKPTLSTNPNASKLGRGRQIGARTFIRHYRIRPNTVCPARLEDGLLVFDVGEPCEEPGESTS